MSAATTSPPGEFRTRFRCPQNYTVDCQNRGWPCRYAARHTIIVRASDGAGGFDTQTFTIEVTNVNPTTPTDSDGATGGSVAEGGSGTVGITASSTDPNGIAGGLGVIYSLTDDAGGRFTINSSTGVVSVANSALLNYEDATSHSITVQASDGAGGTSSASFTIEVTNVSPTVPTDSDGATGGSVAQGGSGAVGITASSTDPNGIAGNAGVIYSLDDNAGGRFAIDANSGIVTVANSALLNYEDNTSHTIIVRASDGAGGFDTQTFTIEVANVERSRSGSCRHLKVQRRG